MAFKRKDSPYYHVRRRNLIGYGDTKQISTRVKQKGLAIRMEHALEDLARKVLLEPRFRRLLDAVCTTKEVDLATLLAARDGGRLEELLRDLDEPLLHDAIQDGIDRWSENRHAVFGLTTLREYTSPAHRLSYIADAKRITDLCHQVESDRKMKRNSVRRRFLQSISKLLTHHLNRSERNRIFADVTYAGKDDTRDIALTPTHIARLLEACEQAGDPELHIIIRLALLTSADRSVLLPGRYEGDKMARGLLKRDLRIDVKNGELSGTVTLEDRKTKSRTRTVPLTPSLCEALLPLVIHKGPDDPVFSMTYGQLDHRWRSVRKIAGLEHVRFKDLRAQISQYGEEAGVPLTVLQATMGHSDVQMTRRYQRRQVVMSTEHALKIEAAMELQSGGPDDHPA
jgi:integrase